MKLLNKLKGFLFDEVQEEIPVITKEEEKKESIREKTVVSESPKRRANKDSNEVIIEKIETPKREKRFEDTLSDDYDMPKLKEEAKKEVAKSTFTFPVFDDDEKDVRGLREEPRKRETKPERTRFKDETKERSRTEREKNVEKPKDSIGYTNAFDYSYGKYKGDYKASREQSRELLTNTVKAKEEHKGFTPSPIISPVWGVLNENYKKEDIVSRGETKTVVTELDLDSVRKKAYGTLEDEIEVSLGKQVEVEPKEEAEEEFENEEGISIDDLLVEKVENSEDTEEKQEDYEEEPFISSFDDEPVEASYDEEEEVLDEIIPIADDEASDDTSVEDNPSNDEEKEKSIPSVSSLAKEEEKKIKTEEEPTSEEDLFDLIESIYERKDED